MATANTLIVTELATFGAGCFWSTEKCFRNQFGTKLSSTVVGYMCDTSPLDNEEIFTSSTSNHVEVLQISFDRKKVAYNDLVHFFFHMHDPTISGNDRTTQYRSIIFTHIKEQQTIAEQIRDNVQVSDKIKGRIITQIQPIDGFQFYIAEQKHQNYLDNKYGWLKQSYSSS